MGNPSSVSRLGLSTEQLASVIERGHDLALVAGAGSGKTRTLVARYLALLEEGVPLRSIIAITFTEKAAREMRNRVRAEIQRLLDDRSVAELESAIWQARYEELNAARITTIHALCAQILRMHPAEAALDPRFEVLAEIEQRRLIQTSIDAVLGWAVMQEEMAPLLQALDIDALRGVLSESVGDRGRIARLLTPGYEQPWERWTAVMMRFLNEAMVDPRYGAGIDYFRELAEDGTIAMAESKGDKLAPNLWSALECAVAIDEALQKSDWPEALVHLTSLRSSLRKNVGTAKNWPEPSPKKNVVEMADWYDETIQESLGKSKDLDLDLDRRTAPLIVPLQRLISQVLEAYRFAKEARGALDFDDLEHGALDLLRRHAPVRAHWQSQASAILVDEFQDTNQQQRDLVALLNSETPDDGAGIPGSVRTAGKLFIVGDAKQSIYRFRGAEVQVFRAERSRIRERGGMLYELAISYRGHASLIQGLNDLLSVTLAQHEDPLRPYVEPFAPLQAHRQDPASGLAEPFIEWHLALGSKVDQGLLRAAMAIAQRLRQLVKSCSVWVGQGDERRLLDYGDVAILCSKRSIFPEYEAALEQAGIPYVTVSGGGFYDRPEIRDVVNLIRAIADVDDDLALAGALRSPAFAVSDVGLGVLCGRQNERDRNSQPVLSLWDVVTKVAQGARLPGLDEATTRRVCRAHSMIDDWRASVQRISVARLLKRVLDATHYRALLIGVGQQRAVRNLDKLLADAQELDLVSVYAFLDYVTLLRDVGAREGEARTVSEGAVQIMTVHGAKGLEFPIVVLGDLNASPRGQAPTLIADEDCGLVLKLASEIKGAKSATYALVHKREKDAEEEESRRLLYVAATRARELLLAAANVTLTTKGCISGPQGGLKWWGEAAGLLAMDCSLEGQVEPVRRRLVVGQTPIACTLYPETYAPLLAQDHEPVQASVSLIRPALLASLPGADESSSGDLADAEPERPIRRVVVGSQSHAPAWVVGQVVHRALEQWRFPDAGFPEWVHGTSQEFLSLPDNARADLTRKATRLLNRFRAEPLYQRMVQSPILRHEVPYSLERDGRVESGRLDALFGDTDGSWHIVEFKTDRISSQSLEDILGRGDQGYLGQVWRYVSALERLLGMRPGASLVLLDFHGATRIIDPSEYWQDSESVG